MGDEASYNRICDLWENFRRHAGMNPCVVRWASGLPRGASVLDVGCGTGYPIDAYLAECGFSLTGIDASEKMIEKAKALKLEGAVFLTVDLLRFLPARTYDAVIAFDSLWHIAYERQAEIYPKISSLLNPKGSFFFTHGKRDGKATGTMLGETFHYASLSSGKVFSLLEQNGFEIVSSEEDFAEPVTGDRELMVTARKSW